MSAYIYTMYLAIEKYMETFVEITPYIELLICVPCIVINIYCAIRFANLHTFNNNFRIIMIVTNFIGVGVSLLHAVISITPRQYISLESQYYNAVAFYSIAYIHQWCLLVFDIKFFILGFERWLGFRTRATYEHSEDNTSIKIYCSLVVLAFLALTTKVYFYLAFNDMGSNDTFRRAFVVDDDLPTMLSTHTLALFGWIYAFVIFRQLLRQAEAHRYSSQSLSESYVIKETIRINTVIGPIVRAYLAMAIACAIIMAINLYCMQYGYWAMRSTYYQSLTNVEYIMVNTYNFYATSYTIWYFRPLRKIFLDDLKTVFKCSIHMENRVSPVDRLQDPATVHFDQLNSQWQ